MLMPNIHRYLHALRLMFIIGLLCYAAGVQAQSRTSSGGKLLVFTKTAGYRHASIPDGVAAIRLMGRQQHFRVDTTSDARWFNGRVLARYDAVVFLSTSGDMLDTVQQAAFERYIRGGGGYLGIHGAAASEYDWSWYGGLVGAFFSNHPHPQQARLVIHPDPAFPVMDSLPNPWIRTDEWYNFRSLPRDVHVLVTVDEKSYSGGNNGAYHPLVWYHDYQGGRAFYLGLGHTPESYTDPYFLKLLDAAIHYAMGRG